MKFSNTLIHRTSAVAIALVIVGCGGGGGGNTTAVTPRIYTASDAKLVAGLGLLTVDAVSGHAQLEQAFFANFVQGFSSAGSAPLGSSPSLTIPCASGGSGSGNFTVGVSKSGTYVGLKTNDTLNLSFNGCSLSGTSLTLNGQAIIVATADNLNLPSNFLAQYRLSTSNFDMSTASGRFRSSGMQTIRYDAIAAGPSFPDLSSSVASSYTLSFFSPATAAIATININLNPGAVVTSKITTSNTFLTSFSGDVQSSTSTSAVTTRIVTATPLGGSSIPTAGRTVPTSGILNVTDTTLNLATSTTIQPVAAFVKFDSNGDGSLESTFTSTYTALTTF